VGRKGGIKINDSGREKGLKTSKKVQETPQYSPCQVSEKRGNHGGKEVGGLVRKEGWVDVRTRTPRGFLYDRTGRRKREQLNGTMTSLRKRGKGKDFVWTIP